MDCATCTHRADKDFIDIISFNWSPECEHPVLDEPTSYALPYCSSGSRAKCSDMVCEGGLCEDYELYESDGSDDSI